MHNETELSEYVQQALALQGLEVDSQRLNAITQQFTLLANMASSFLAEPLPPELESAAVYQL